MKVITAQMILNQISDNNKTTRLMSIIFLVGAGFCLIVSIGSLPGLILAFLFGLIGISSLYRSKHIKKDLHLEYGRLCRRKWLFAPCEHKVIKI